VWATDEIVFRHDYSARDREVLVQFPIGTLADTLGWFPHVVKFQQRHCCRLTCSMSPLIIPLLRQSNPDVTFVAHEEVRPEKYCATYSMGLFFDDKDNLWQPCDFRHVGLHRTAGHILAVDPDPGVSLHVAMRYDAIGI
jgi:autotransporter strand-loop-strand O-heptosyltransferase